jgi:hypothetical protein
MDEPVIDIVPPPENLLRHAIGILSIVSVLFSALVILTYGTGAAFRAVRACFAAFILSEHIVSIVKFLGIKTCCGPDIKKRLFVSKDVHYFTVFVVFTIADLTPIFTVVNYAITLGSIGLNYLAEDLLPLLGESASESIEIVKTFAAHEAVTFVPVYLEIALIFQLIVVALADWTLINVATLAVYIAWLVMFNYGTSAQHRQVWGSMWRWMRGNGNSSGPLIDWIGCKLTKLGAVALRWYE